MTVHKPIAIKICGMRDHRNIMEVASLNPQYMGFIFYGKSPRFVGDDLKLPSLPSSIKKVGVFVNEKIDVIAKRGNKFGFDFVQLHGDETSEQCAELKDLGIKIVKAFALDENFDFRDITPFKKHVEFFLFDTKGKYYGGNAKLFDWALLKKYDQEVPFFLSGGLSAANIEQLGDVANMNLHALDLNSGVEEAPGLKSIDKVRAAFLATRSLKQLNT
jgi:phosphoribosylanthranilate isomerase